MTNLEEIKNEEIKEEEEVKDVKEAEAPSEASKEVKEEKPDVEEKPLNKMTVPELKEVALGIPGVTGVTAMKKDELLALIKEYRGIEDEKKPGRKKKVSSVDGVSIKELKQKIAKLSADKEAAHGEKDRKKVNILRRRINRLKKRTRKAARG